MARKTYRPENQTDIDISVEEDNEENVSEETEVNVLHVDDSPEFVEMAAVYLQKNHDSLNVETETDPTDALERLEDEVEKFDCVVSDCSMPDMSMDGMDLHDAVRTRHPNLPFVFFTGTPLSEFPEDTVTDESTGHMQKEIDVKQFSNLAGWISETVE